MSASSFARNPPINPSIQEFFKPIITPFELEIAISADRSWTGEYILDFGRILERNLGSGEERKIP